MKRTYNSLLKVFLGCFFLFNTQLFAQRLETSKLTNEWQLLKQEQGIKFYVKQQDAVIFEGKKPFNYAIMKVENTTSKDAKLLYNFAVYYNEGCVACGESQEARKLIEVGAGQSVTGTYDSGNCPTSVLLYNPNNAMSWKPQFIQIENLIINY